MKPWGRSISEIRLNLRLTLADQVLEKIGTTSKIVEEPLPADDPTQRKPDITLAKEVLDWTPKIELSEGLDRTIPYFKERLDA